MQRLPPPGQEHQGTGANRQGAGGPNNLMRVSYTTFGSSQQMSGRARGQGSQAILQGRSVAPPQYVPVEEALALMQKFDNQLI